ncbi:MAG: glycerol-3-phosphate dehydrogenase [Bdellovibrionaceae bacterium]|nr:glycerol-3-phosphate dehydrogenase [Pseudobdellovibrionaceae bacterium]
MFSKYTRHNTLSSCSDKDYDLIIIGGGITGAGVARDATSRGMKVLLCEAHDFASGTSSRSSKLVHGGIRYLENLEFGLVHEALVERTLLLKTAPHMVHPLRFLLPVYKTSRVGLFKMEMGMILYDLLSFFEAPELHELHFKQSTEQAEPLLKQENLVGSVIYSDAYMEDDRLAVEVLKSAHEMGADIVNYTKVTRLTESAQGVEVELVDQKTSKLYRAHARHIITSVGPWTDMVGADLLSQWKPVMRPTKGVHLVFSRARIPVQRGIVMGIEQRIVFVIPRGDIVIVGTTDTDYPGDPGKVKVEKEDVRYLLEVTNGYFPSLHLSAEDVISCYAGVRPLVKDEASSEGKTSREHVIYNPTPKVTLVAGGKYTTYRAMAEQIVDSALDQMGFEEKMKWRASNTKNDINKKATHEKIRRLRGQVGRIAEKYGQSELTVQDLIGRRGEDALEILETMQQFHKDPTEVALWKAELKFAFDHEMCLSLKDFYWRRSPLFLHHEDNGLSVLVELAQYLGELNHLAAEQVQLEVREVTASIAEEKRAISELF